MIAESLLTGVAFGYLILAPYTKVEESFNIQACHDMLYHGPFLSRYDHHEYPGVVPRSFLGPAMLSTLALPFVTTARVMGVNKIYSQYLVRLALSLLVVFAWSRFYQQVKKGFGMGVAVWFTAITITQFHFVYYLSRTLPNSFALIFALLSCSYWLEQNHKKFIVASGIGVAIFRIDLVLMLGPMLVHDLVTKRIGLKSCLFQSVTVGGTLLAVTVAFDSLLWGRWVWPEGEVFYYNTILNQSHHWGTQPLPWYFYSALPRALGASILFVPVGIVLDKRMRLLTAPALVMVALFSLLPHKELRFIIYVVPLFNVAAAYACQNLYMRCRKSTRWSALSAVVVGHLLLNCLLTALLASASAANYPGGVALWRLHELVPAEAHVSVHIDNLAAQSGATRFLQMHPNWHYNKTEDLRPGSRELRSFSHLLVEAKNKYAYNLKHYADTHRILEAVEAFSHLSFNYQQFPPVKIRMKPTLFILENQRIEDILSYHTFKEPEVFTTDFSESFETDDLNATLLTPPDQEEPVAFKTQDSKDKNEKMLNKKAQKKKIDLDEGNLEKGVPVEKSEVGLGEDNSNTSETISIMDEIQPSQKDGVLVLNDVSSAKVEDEISENILNLDADIGSEKQKSSFITANEGENTNKLTKETRLHRNMKPAKDKQNTKNVTPTAADVSSTSEREIKNVDLDEDKIT